MRAFIDFEASSPGRRGYPIEVAWVFENGCSENYLISPRPHWTEWDRDAEAIHGLSRERLTTEGVCPDLVARRLVDALQDHDVFASAPSCGGKWLSVLLISAGLPARAVQLQDTDIALLELADAVLTPILPSSKLRRAARKIVECAGDRFEGRRRARRALLDAQLERERWLVVSKLAHTYASRF